MYNILITNKNFLFEILKKKLEKEIKKKIIIHSKTLIEIKIDNKEDFKKISLKLIIKNRLIENIYLKITKKDINKYLNMNFNLEIKKFNLSLLGLNLLNFKLENRDFKLNFNKKSLNPYLIQKLFFYFQIGKSQIKILDPLANLGDLSIEILQTIDKDPIFLKKIHKTPLNLIFKIESNEKVKTKIKTKVKFLTIVQNSQDFKQIKENILFSNKKILISNYNLNLLDVKFKKNEIDYIMTYLYNDELNKKSSSNLEEELLYQSEFICKEKIGIISSRLLNLKLISKFKLKIEIKEKINIDEQIFYIYILKKIKE